MQIKKSFKITKNTKSLISFFLIFAFTYFIMCPFAFTLTSANGSQLLIPQRQLIKNHFKQKDHISSPVHFFKEIKVETGAYNMAVINLPMNTHQEPAFSLFIITTIRLII